jgi:hypothetical protein
MREAQRALHRAIVPTLSRKAIEAAARPLGFLDDGTILAETENDIALVTDTALYDYYASGDANAVERYAAQHDASGDEALALEAMRRARFTLIEVLATVDGLGARVRDVIFDEELLLAGVGLAPGQVIAARLLTFDTFGMTTGVTLPFDREVAALVRRSFGELAGMAADLRPRESSFLARLLLQLAMIEPEDALALMEEFAGAPVRAGDPRRGTQRRTRDAGGELH